MPYTLAHMPYLDMLDILDPIRSTELHEPFLYMLDILDPIRSTELSLS